MHTPCYKEYPGAEKIVIFIHGFMGSPDQFTDLAEAVYERGRAYSSILLSGHGVRAGEFLKFGAAHWQDCVQNEIDKFAGKYDKIFLAGHSMGGLLALKASLASENKIAGVFMLASPLGVNMLNPKANLLRLRLLSYRKTHQIKAGYIKSNSIKGTKNIFLYPLFIKPILEFYKVVRDSKKILKDVSVPVCMIHSKKDETTAFRSQKLMSKGMNGGETEAVTLKGSLHVYYTEEDRQIIKEKLIQFAEKY